MRVILLLLASLLCTTVYAVESNFHLRAVKVDVHDQPSLQRGARLFINYCSGCHSLKYVRYHRMAKDLGIVDSQGEVATDIVKKNLMIGARNIWDPIITSLSPSIGAKWFGKMPPDLSLTARARGPKWIFNYLLSFYRDDNSLWGSNNAVYPNTAMPNVLYNLQGEQEAIYSTDKKDAIERLVITHPGQMAEPEFKSAMHDLVNFLTYIGEPAQLIRYKLAPWILSFLLILVVLSFLLMREYWKDVN